MAIPASFTVGVNPGVVTTGGNPLSLNGVYVSQSAYLPTNSVQSFSSPDAVKTFFGAASSEYAQSQKYFAGFDNSATKPGTVYFAPYVATARAAWLQTGSLASLTLTQLQALTGVLTLTMNGTVKTSSTINLSAATSFSNAATLIAAAFTSGPAVTWDAIKGSFIFTSTTTGTASTITEASGTLSAGLKATLATGALLSQGAAVDTPATCMDMVKNQTQNWVTFTTMFEPVLADKTAFAVWSNAQNSRFCYVCWDTDAQAIVNGSTTCFGAVAKAAQYDGVMCVYNTLESASLVLGSFASVDFTRFNGRIDLAFKHQSGLAATVTDQQIATNLLANGYSYYGVNATANDQFIFFYNGNMPGRFKFVDSFVNEVYLNSQFQLAELDLLTSVNSIPYNAQGYSLIRAAMLDPIQQGLNSGIIRKGVTLSNSQKAQINQAAGLDISSTVETQGWYLQILDPGAQVRGLRGSPIINFWYTDGQSVQKMTIASINIL